MVIRIELLRRVPFEMIEHDLRDAFDRLGVVEEAGIRLRSKLCYLDYW